VQQAVRLLEIVRALAHAELQLLTALAQLAHRLLELPKERREDKARKNDRGHEKEEQKQRLVQRHG